MVKKYQYRFVNALGLLIIIFFSACSNTNYGKNYRIQKGVFKVAIVESGELEATKARTFIMPLIGYDYGHQFKITGLLEHGTVVEVGDSLIQFDVASVQKYIVNKEDELEIEEAALSKLVVEQRNKQQSLFAALRNEEAVFNLRKLEVGKFKFESPVKKKIKEMEFKQANIKLNKTKRKIELGKRVSECELGIQKLKVVQIKNSIDKAYYSLKKLTVRSTMSGIFQVRESRRTDQPYKVGDDIYMGRAVGSVPDLEFMKVSSQISETDIMKVKTGQRVIVRIDAYPSISFEGTLSHISKMCHEKDDENKLKIFDTIISIDSSDERLKPGMTVNCEIVCDEIEDVFFVHNDCLLNDKGDCYIQLKDGVSVNKTKVKTGAKNTNYTVIYGEFKKNQKVFPFEENVGSLNI
jgi:hypothetical protein